VSLCHYHTRQLTSTAYIVRLLNDSNQFIWYPVVSDESPDGVAVETVIGLEEIHDVYLKWGALLKGLLHNDAERGDLVSAWSALSEACLVVSKLHFNCVFHPPVDYLSRHWQVWCLCSSHNCWGLFWERLMIRPSFQPADTISRSQILSKSGSSVVAVISTSAVRAYDWRTSAGSWNDNLVNWLFRMTSFFYGLQLFRRFLTRNVVTKLVWCRWSKGFEFLGVRWDGCIKWNIYVHVHIDSIYFKGPVHSCNMFVLTLLLRCDYEKWII
jgi:hypothetical protein